MSAISSNVNYCPICLDELKDDSIIPHSKGGEKHKLHSKCLLECLKRNSNCPVCRKFISNKFITNITNDRARSRQIIYERICLGLSLASLISIIYQVAQGVIKTNEIICLGTFSVGFLILSFTKL